MQHGQAFFQIQYKILDFRNLLWLIFVAKQFYHIATAKLKQLLIEDLPSKVTMSKKKIVQIGEELDFSAGVIIFIM
jgi:hypothetical protein